MLLGRRGCDVRVAPLVAEALVAWRSADVVVLDLMLPDGSGRDVLAAIRAEAAPIRVLVTTGSCDREVLRQVDALGPDAVLRKPIDFDQLLRALGLQR
jgi:DNA-binding NarL/FixJ family response regulator